MCSPYFLPSWQLKEFGPDGFGVWDDWHSEDLTLNICDGEERKQSPKDMVETIPCNATHEIRTKVRLLKAWTIQRSHISLHSWQ